MLINMKTSLILLLLCTSIAVNAATYYVATTGSDSNPGTITQPWATWQYSFNRLKAGDILYVRGGNYTTMLGRSGNNYYGVLLQSISGTSGSHITVSAYSGEVPILDGQSLTSTSGSNIGMGIYGCSYWDFNGLNVTNFKQYSDNIYEAAGWYESDVAHITHTLCSDYHCGDGFVLKGTHDDIHYTNCDSFENADRFDDPSGAPPGSLANGFFCTPNAGNHIYYIGCRAWNNSDDGWDTYNSYGGYIEFTNCWAFNNGWYLNTIGDGSGFKLGIVNGPLETGTQRSLKNCLAFGNLGPGYDQNSGSSGTKIQFALYNCTSASNQSGTFSFYYDTKAVIRNCISYNESLGDIGKSTLIDHNSWQNGLSATSADFLSVTSAAATGPRETDGSLPAMTYLHLASGSHLIDAGVNVGIIYAGNAPDLGAFETQTGLPVAIPSFSSASIENATPSLLEMTYNMNLANIVPAVSAFSVLVNSITRSVNSVIVSGTKVQLTLASPVVSGNTVTVAYTIPSANPLQSTSGGQALSIGAQTVTNRVTVTNPAYVSSAVENATPTLLEMTYNMALANIVPDASAFSVKVNSVTRAINSVSVSGTKVQLTLASPILFGDVITVSYIKPSVNPLQTASGGQAVSVSAQTVTNRVNVVIPVYVSSSVENATPSLLELTYNLTLTDIVPAKSAFSVTVNSVVRTVNSVSVSGTKVQLTLANPIVNGNIVTVSYTKPSANPLQSAAGGQAVSISAQPVTNRVIGIIPVYVSSAIENATPTLLEMTYNTTLANVIPTTSAFLVYVNSVGRKVNSVAISGTKVQLTLVSPIVFGNAVTVTYTKPSVNPLQSTSGGQAITINSQTVLNRVNPVNPDYVSSAVENATPSILEMTYNLTLANVIPATSAFSVRVNSVTRSVTSVSISGTRVQLTLSSPVLYRDIITVAYTKPSVNPIQTTSGGVAVTINAQSVTNRVNAPSPVYVSSAIENSTPALLEMTYNITLANIVPATSAFTVLIGSAPRTVSSVAVSGTKVQLTLASPVVYGNNVTITYTKPTVNPLQTTDGGQAITINAQIVTNRVNPVSPVYVGSAVANATPSILEMTYNLTLANVVPAASAFLVQVNSVTRSVISVSISGTRVQLTLASPVVYGNIITVAYTKPSVNPVQTSTGGQAVTISPQPVTNRVNAAIPVYVSSAIENSTPALLEMTYNMALANRVPATSAFTVLINSTPRAVASVTVSGTKVQLTLASPVVYGNNVTITYTKPSVNPLQTTDGGQAVTINTQTVINRVNPVSPVYVSSAVENATPSVLEMTYNLMLANVVPATSAFTVRVNSVTRRVAAVSVSGTIVRLTLSSPIVYGNTVTIAYTKPSSNSLQTSEGGQAGSISSTAVTNRVNPVSPVYVSSVIQNSTSSLLEMTYNLTLANIVPPVSAFSVHVNSISRTVSKVTISGTKVRLTLASPIIYGDVVTIIYIKPSLNPLQTSSGGQAISISAQPVINNVNAVIPVYISSVVEKITPDLIEMTYSSILAKVIPATSSFSVRVNSEARAVNSVTVSGVKVGLILESPVVFGDVITVSYTRPSINPLQTPSTGLAASIVNQPVTNSWVNNAPTVEISSPVFNSLFIAPATITFTAAASDSDGSISLVEFYSGNIKLDSMTSAPYTFDWTNVAAGDYILTVTATDNLNAKTISSEVSISVIYDTTAVIGDTTSVVDSTTVDTTWLNLNPVVNIASPQKGNTFENNSSIAIEAIASDPDGSISKVEIYNGSVKIVELDVAPYTFTWKDVEKGNYSITAVATDNLGATTTSIPIDFVVEDINKSEIQSELFKLYPNPNDGHFSVEFSSPAQNEKSQIIITDLAGKEVYIGTILKEEILRVFDLSDSKSGIYIMMIKNKEILAAKKFIKN
jgi:uncharacterized repeat protein (TIGR02059 family)